jgi:hypothetical protein
LSGTARSISSRSGRSRLASLIQRGGAPLAGPSSIHGCAGRHPSRTLNRTLGCTIFATSWPPRCSLPAYPSRRCLSCSATPERPLRSTCTHTRCPEAIEGGGDPRRNSVGQPQTVAVARVRIRSPWAVVGGLAGQSMMQWSWSPRGSPWPSPLTAGRCGGHPAAGASSRSVHRARARCVGWRHR